MSNNMKSYSIDLAGRKLTFEIGEVAKQANGALMVRYGDTSVLVAATASKEPKDLPFFPLTINYEERLYAVGKIPGGFIKREGKPSDTAVLNSRLIDRPIRPLFPDGFRNEVQVISTVLSVDQNCPSDIAAMIGSSLALSISDIPFDGPIAGVHIGRIDDEFIINPTVEQSHLSDLHLTVAGTKDAINMVEASANEVTEDIMLEAIMFAHEEIKKLVEFQEKIVQEVGKEKMDITLFVPSEDIEKRVTEMAKDKLLDAIQTVDKLSREAAIDNVKEEVISIFEEEEAENDVISQVNAVLDTIVKNEVRRLITEEKVRHDGRKIDEIRQLSTRINVLSRTHSSALFTRCHTQALSFCTF